MSSGTVIDAFAGAWSRYAVPARRMGGAALLIALAELGLFDIVNLLRAVSIGGPAGDYRAYHAAALIGLREGWHLVYKPELQFHYEQATWPGSSPMIFITTLPVAWLSAPFALLPPRVGYLAFAALMAGSLLAAAWLAARPEWRWRSANCLILLAFGPAVLCILEGQVVALVALSVVGAWRLLWAGHEVAAGVVLAGLAVKPQTAILVPLAVVLGGHWRAGLSLAIASAAIAGASLLALGQAGTEQYLREIRYVSGLPGNDPWPAWSWLQGPVAPALQVVVVVVTALVAWLGWRRRPANPDLPVAAGLVGSLLLARYGHTSDLVMYAPIVWLALRAPAHWVAWAAAIAAWVLVEFESGQAAVTFVLGFALLAALGVGAWLGGATKGGWQPRSPGSALQVAARSLRI